MIKINLNETATHLYAKNFDILTKNEQYYVVAKIANDIISNHVKQTKKVIKDNHQKQVFYFSMEFLMGRLFTNNLLNLGLYDTFDQALKPYGISIKDIEFEELDAGLGNGGLGRLAACFMDSIASTNYPGHGITIRYRNGFFKQIFENGYQQELPDLWLKNGNAWENKIIDDVQTISFYGTVIKKDNQYITIDDLKVSAMPYDMPLVGSHICNTLRMYDIQPIETQKNFAKYEKAILDITSNLYPDDSTDEGKELRLKQQYFFVSAGIQNIIKHHLKVHKTLDNLADFVVMQINDTHPTLLIPELMRLLIDVHGYNYEKAWTITSKSIAYTNHTILAEALEKWDITLIKPLLPRVYMLIEQINQQFIEQLQTKGYSQSKIDELSILSPTQIRMANLAIVASFSVNGVAALHTKILIEKEMKDWHELYPNKFNNKTNGITHRRWFEYSNPQLFELIKKVSCLQSIDNPITFFETFEPFKTDDSVQKQVQQIKHNNKLLLKAYMLEHEGIEIDEHTIFDIQIKRLHAYKRQLLNVLHIIYLYQRLKTDEQFKMQFTAQTFIFGAKAAPSYVFAKNVIKLIQSLANIINNDTEVNSLLKVVMVTNYNVSYAEKLIPAADVSEQISTAGYEASGTGNMKFMMNGALTIGTLDGANVEIHDLVGDDNMFIFGMSKDEVVKVKENNTYSAKAFIKDHAILTHVFDFIRDLHTIDANIKENEFEPIFNDIFDDNDYYLVLKDFDSYVSAQNKINQLYKNQSEWTTKAIANIAKSGFFSSDRTINDYVTDIWHLERIK